MLGLLLKKYKNVFFLKSHPKLFCEYYVIIITYNFNYI